MKSLYVSTVILENETIVAKLRGSSSMDQAMIAIVQATAHLGWVIVAETRAPARMHARTHAGEKSTFVTSERGLQGQREGEREQGSLAVPL